MAWHNVFHNLFSEEAISLVKKSFKAGFKSLPEIISFIKRGFYPNQTIPETTKNDLNDWRKIFGQRQNPNCRWIKKFILRNWTYPGVKAVVSGKKIVKVMIYLEKISKTNRIIKNIHKCKNVKILENGKLLKIT